MHTPRIAAPRRYSGTMCVVSHPVSSPRTRSLWRAGLLFLGSLLPALLAVLPLTLGAAWYLSDDGNTEFLTPGRVWFEVSLVAIAVAPFVAAVVSLASVLQAGRDLDKALRVASVWAFLFGWLALAAFAFSTGGF